MSQASLLPPAPCPFVFRDHQIRTVIKKEQPWFIAKDVCSALGMGWNGTVLANIPMDWQRMRKFRTLSRGSQNLKIISEPAVYKLAFRSNKEDADAFTNWIASEVVPSIRKTGAYSVQSGPKALPEPEAPCLSKRGDPNRKALTTLISTWVDVSPFGYRAAWQQVNAHFRVSSVDELTWEQVNTACVWVQERIDRARLDSLPRFTEPEGELSGATAQLFTPQIERTRALLDMCVTMLGKTKEHISMDAGTMNAHLKANVLGDDLSRAICNQVSAAQAALDIATCNIEAAWQINRASVKASQMQGL